MVFLTFQYQNDVDLNAHFQFYDTRSQNYHGLHSLFVGLKVRTEKG